MPKKPKKSANAMKKLEEVVMENDEYYLYEIESITENATKLKAHFEEKLNGMENELKTANMKWKSLSEEAVMLRAHKADLEARFERFEKVEKEFETRIDKIEEKFETKLNKLKARLEEAASERSDPSPPVKRGRKRKRGMESKPVKSKPVKSNQYSKKKKILITKYQNELTHSPGMAGNLDNLGIEIHLADTPLTFPNIPFGDRGMPLKWNEGVDICIIMSKFGIENIDINQLYKESHYKDFVSQLETKIPENDDEFDLFWPFLAEVRKIQANSRSRITAYFSRRGHSKRKDYALNTSAPASCCTSCTSCTSPSGSSTTSGGGEIYPDKPTNYAVVNHGSQGFERSSLTPMTNQISEPSDFSEGFRYQTEHESTYEDLSIDKPTGMVVIGSEDQGFSSLTPSTNDGQLPSFSEGFCLPNEPVPIYGVSGVENGLGAGYEMPAPGVLGYPEVVDIHVPATLTPLLPRQARVDKDETTALDHVVTNGKGFN